MKFNAKFVVVIMIVLAIAVGCTLTGVVVNSTDIIDNLTVSKAETANRALVSAISEESAAASQELSGQSAQLDDIITRFERENQTSNKSAAGFSI